MSVEQDHLSASPKCLALIDEVAGTGDPIMITKNEKPPAATSFNALQTLSVNFNKVTLDPTAAAIGGLVLGERGKEASCWAAFLVRLLGELGRHQFDGGQAQVGERRLDAR